MTHIMHYPMDARERGETVEVEIEKDKAFLSMILVPERERGIERYSE